MKDCLIAPCGMNCALCVSYQAGQLDLAAKGLKRKTCPGCRPRGKGCLHLASSCGKLAKNQVDFCFECADYPCRRLKDLDKRYRTRYHMSMLENLESVRTKGMQAFLTQQGDLWNCPDCGQPVCCHIGLCLVCDLDKLKNSRSYRWGYVRNKPKDSDE